MFLKSFDNPELATYYLTELKREFDAKPWTFEGSRDSDFVYTINIFNAVGDDTSPVWRFVDGIDVGLRIAKKIRQNTLDK